MKHIWLFVVCPAVGLLESVTQSRDTGISRYMKLGPFPWRPGRSYPIQSISSAFSTHKLREVREKYVP